MSIKSWIRNWLHSDGISLKMGRSEVADTSPPEQGAQIYISEAMNGRVLTIRTYKPINPQYGNNWVSELYVLKDGESLTEALTMLLTLKGIDK
jgi:hypothetical protein